MRRLILIVIFIVSLFIIKNFVDSIYNLWQKQDLSVQAQKQLEIEKKRNQELKDELSRVESSHFIEEQARNKLFMIKPGEQEVLIPSPSSISTASDNLKKESYWKQWWKLFF